MDFELSYHLWCQRKFNPLSHQHFMFVKIDSIIKTCQDKSRCSYKIWEDSLITKLMFSSRATNECCILRIRMMGWMKKFNKLKFLRVCLDYLYVRIWAHRFGVHVDILVVVKAHWPHDECLSRWAWMSILKHLWCRMLSTSLKIIDSYNGQHPKDENLPPYLRTSKKLH